MMFISCFLLSSIFLGVEAHMRIVTPYPFRHPSNPYTTNPDWSLTNPLSSSGSDFPCKGYQVDFGTAAGTPTATWAAGSTVSLTLEGTAVHKGGSCQISLSFDGGKTFRVIKSYHGNCVRVIGDNADSNQTYSFTIPSSTKAGDLILSWSWFNEIGNREMYQNCGAVTITGSGTSTLSEYPNMFVAHVNNGCSIAEGVDVLFPNPGSDITTVDTGKLGNPVGTC